MRGLGVALVAVMLAACSNEASYEGSICEQAAAHVRACAGYSMELGPSCDVELASAVLDEDCSALSDPGKADLFGGLFCRLGFFHRCAAPRCMAVRSEPAADCSEHIDTLGCGSCEYYRCRDAAREEPCGANGYYEGFAYRYCVLFAERTEAVLSPRGRAWTARVRPCLQAAMESIGDDATCDEVMSHGYGAHPGCYLDTGFCELPITDMIAILKTVAPRDLGTQPFTTAISCLGRYFDPRSGALTDEGLEQLELERGF